MENSVEEFLLLFFKGVREFVRTDILLYIRFGTSVHQIRTQGFFVLNTFYMICQGMDTVPYIVPWRS